MNARPLINSLEFAQKGLELTGEIPFNELLRLREELVDTNGVLSYYVQGGVNKKGDFWLDITVNGACSLTCQRCLSGMDYQIAIDTRLILRDQATLDAMDDDEEEFESILAEPHMDVLELLEDEVLLSLPIAPKHEAGACQTTSGDDVPKDMRNPFAVLADLKRK